MAITEHFLLVYLFANYLLMKNEEFEAYSW